MTSSRIHYSASCSSFFNAKTPIIISHLINKLFDVKENEKKMLLQFIINIMYRFQLTTAFFKKDKTYFETLQFETAIYFFCELIHFGDLETIKKSLALNENIFIDFIEFKRSILHLAACFNRVDVMDYLINDLHYSVNSMIESHVSLTNETDTPLSIAIANQKIAAIRYLVDHGAQLTFSVKNVLAMLWAQSIIHFVENKLGCEAVSEGRPMRSEKEEKYIIETKEIIRDECLILVNKILLNPEILNNPQELFSKLLNVANSIDQHVQDNPKKLFNNANIVGNSIQKDLKSALYNRLTELKDIFLICTKKKEQDLVVKLNH